MVKSADVKWYLSSIQMAGITVTLGSALGGRLVLGLDQGMSMSPDQCSPRRRP